MPFSGGCGIHDATWRSSFGGDQYLYDGSHGCVGVSLSNAKTIYNNVSVGTIVVVYGGASQQHPPRTQNITASITNPNLVVGDQTTVSVSSQTTPSSPPATRRWSRWTAAAMWPPWAPAPRRSPCTALRATPTGEASATVSVTVSEPAHVHSWDGGTVTLAATCTAEGVMTYTCTGCGVARMRPSRPPATPGPRTTPWTRRRPAPRTAAVPSTAPLCGETKDSQVIPATGHQWDGGVETTPPTSSAPGVKTYTCTVCGGTRTEKSPPQGTALPLERVPPATPPPGPPLPQAEPPRGAKHLFPTGGKGRGKLPLRRGEGQTS